MAKQKVSVLGSTGSIGTQTLEICANFPSEFEVTSLTAGKNLSLLKQQILAFNPTFVSVMEEQDALSLQREFPKLEIDFGERGLERAARLPSNVVVMGVLGFAALRPTLAAIEEGRKVALANKETLVAGGSLVMERIRKSESTVIPVDSEHNALFQLLEGRKQSEIASIVLTASGGPLLKRPDLELSQVTPEIAVKHPNWSMGAKISVDSATMMNKGLEFIEAHVLFDFAPENIEIWVHPQSIVHGAIWFTDNSCMAQLNKPNMKCSIGHAMHYPKRLPQVIDKLSFADMAKLEFLKPDETRFPAIRLAREALKTSPAHPIVLNASNEIAVHHFLERRLPFDAITRVIEECLNQLPATTPTSIEEIFEIDRAARENAESACLRYGH